MTIAFVAVAIVIAAIAAILILAAAKPNTFRVARAISIKAPPARIFPVISDFHRWTDWSPYEKKDPAMKRAFSDPASGRGATYAWSGNKNIGIGSMEITESLLPSRVALKLESRSPFAINTKTGLLEIHANRTGQGFGSTAAYDPEADIPRRSHCHSVTVRLALDQTRWVGTGRIRE